MNIQSIDFFEKLPNEKIFIGITNAGEPIMETVIESYINPNPNWDEIVRVMKTKNAHFGIFPFSGLRVITENLFEQIKRKS